MEALTYLLNNLWQPFQYVINMFNSIPKGAHNLLHNRINQYLHVAPANMPFPFGALSGFQGADREDLCRDITGMSSKALRELPRACDEHIGKYIDSRVEFIEALLLIIVLLALAWKFPEFLFSCLRSIPLVPKTYIPTPVRRRLTAEQLARRRQQAAELRHMRTMYPILLNFLFAFKMAKKEMPETRVDKYWRMAVTPNLERLIPDQELDPVAPADDDLLLLRDD